MRLSQPRAEAVWLMLVNTCGAHRDDGESFIRYAQEDDPLEFRFQGHLGFGGKLYFESVPRVACYKEDETPERKRIVDDANEFLTALAKCWV